MTAFEYIKCNLSPALASRINICDQPVRAHVFFILIFFTSIILGLFFYKSAELIGKNTAQELRNFAARSSLITDRDPCQSGGAAVTWERPSAVKPGEVAADKCLATLARQTVTAFNLVQGQMLLVVGCVAGLAIVIPLLHRRAGTALFTIIFAVGCLRAALINGQDSNFYECPNSHNSDSFGFYKITSMFLPVCINYGDPWLDVKSVMNSLSAFGLPFDIVAYLIWLAASLMILQLGFVCYRGSGWSSDAVKDLHERRWLLVAASIAGAIIYSTGIFRLKTLIEFPVSLYASQYREPLVMIAQSQVSALSFLFSMTLFLLLALAVAALRSDMSEAAEAAGAKLPSDQRTWIEKQGLGLPAKDLFAAVMASATPLLTPAVADLLVKATGGG